MPKWFLPIVISASIIIGFISSLAIAVNESKKVPVIEQRLEGKLDKETFREFQMGIIDRLARIEEKVDRLNRK